MALQKVQRPRSDGPIDIRPHRVDIAPELHKLGYKGLPKFRLNVVDFGKSDSPTLVFIHGGGGSWMNFTHQLEPFAKMGYRVVAYDANGCGHSDARKCPTVLSHVNDLQALVQKLKLVRFVLIGHSDGAAIAQSYTAVHPERVRAVVLVGAYTRLTARDKMFDAVLRLVPKAEHFPKSIIQLFSKKAFADVDKAEEFIEQNDFPTVRNANAWMASFENFAPPKKPPHVIALLVKGEKDQLVYQDQQKELQHAWHTNLVTIPQAGHVAQWEEPEAFNKVLEDFLRRHSLTPAHKYYG